MFDSKEELLLKLGYNLKLLRVEKKLTQEQLAEKLDFDRTYIGFIERGKRNPSYITLCKISRYFKIPLSVLVQGIK